MGVNRPECTGKISVLRRGELWLIAKEYYRVSMQNVLDLLNQIGIRGIQGVNGEMSNSVVHIYRLLVNACWR